jgi:hypothetical protein
VGHDAHPPHLLQHHLSSSPYLYIAALKSAILHRRHRHISLDVLSILTDMRPLWISNSLLLVLLSSDSHIKTQK